jgi:hypothetical protein
VLRVPAQVVLNAAEQALELIHAELGR